MRCIFLMLTLLVTAFVKAQTHRFAIKDLTAPYLKILRENDVPTASVKLQKLLSSFDSSFYKEVIGFDLSDTTQIAAYLKSIAPARQKISYVGKNFTHHFNQSVNKIAALFPSVRKQTHTVYVVPTFGKTNGQFRYWRGKWMLYFGLDAQAAETGYKDLNALIIHELVHLVHAQKNDSIATQVGKFYENPFSVSLPFYYHLYIEGLAVYFTRFIDKRISLNSALMQSKLAEKVNRQLEVHLQAVGQLLSSTSLQDVQNYFWLNGSDPSVPHKTGYYIGYLLISDMAKRLDRDKLLSLHGRELEKELRQSLEDLMRRSRSRER